MINEGKGVKISQGSTNINSIDFLLYYILENIQGIGNY
jgi:hypothetical protein